MASVLDQAQNFSGGPVAAARQRDRWTRKMANATDEETRERYREAIADLEARYPDLEDVPAGGAEAFARERGHGHGSRSPVHEGRSRARSGTRRSSSSPAPAETRKPSSERPSRKPRAGGARRSPSPTPRVDRAIRQTGIPGAIESGTSTTMLLLGGTLSLSLLYLLLSSAEKSGVQGHAFEGVIDAIVSAVDRFIQPVDFFGPRHFEGKIVGGPAKKPSATPAELDRVEGEAVRRGGRRGIPGEVGSSGIATGDLSNPKAELIPRRRRR